MAQLQQQVWNQQIVVPNLKNKFFTHSTKEDEELLVDKGLTVSSCQSTSIGWAILTILQSYESEVEDGRSHLSAGAACPTKGARCCHL